MITLLLGEAGEVGAGTSQVFPLNNGGVFACRRQVPGDVLSRFTTAQHKHFVFFCARNFWIGYQHQRKRF